MTCDLFKAIRRFVTKDYTEIVFAECEIKIEQQIKKKNSQILFLGQKVILK